MRIHAALFIRREDMVNALGKRPFDTSDDMDKYLDEEVSVHATSHDCNPSSSTSNFVQAKRKAGQISAPPPFEPLPDPSVASSGIPRDHN